MLYGIKNSRNTLQVRIVSSQRLNGRKIIGRLTSTFYSATLSVLCPRRFGAQQNGAIRDKDFAYGGLGQKTGKKLVVPSSKSQDKHNGSRLKGKDDGSIGWGTIYPKRSWRITLISTTVHIIASTIHNPRILGSPANRLLL